MQQMQKESDIVISDKDFLQTCCCRIRECFHFVAINKVTSATQHVGELIVSGVIFPFHPESFCIIIESTLPLSNLFDKDKYKH